MLQYKLCAHAMHWFGNPEHVLSENRCNSTLNQIRTNLFNANITAQQAEVMAQVCFCAQKAQNIRALYSSQIRKDLQQTESTQRKKLSIEPVPVSISQEGILRTLLCRCFLSILAMNYTMRMSKRQCLHT